MSQGTTRRRFLQGSVATVAIAGAARVLPASAAPEPFRLTITEGDLTMVDGTPVFFRGFAGPDGGPPHLPGPPLGNPGPLSTNPEITEGELVRVSITNATPRDHTFLIERTAGEAASSPVVGPVRIPARTTTPVEIQFTAPAAGTYIYRDADRNNRLLGMNGVMVVLPRGARGENRPYAPGAGRLEIPAEVVVQFVWSVHCADPVLGELARQQFLESNISYPLASVLPRYFFINGHHGSEALHDPATVPVLPLQDALGSQVGALIRCVNTGVAVHALHWHGNHVFVLQRNAVPARAGLVFEKDVLRLDPLQRIDVLLPAHTGLDAWPMLTPDHPKVAEQTFPMHCHAEMSQTAGGGLYPLGMVTDWKLSGTAFDARQTTQALVEQAAAIRRSVPGRPAPRPAARRPRLQLEATASPKPARAGRRTRFGFRTTTGTGRRRRPVRGARVRFAGRLLRTGPGGRVRTSVRFRRPRRAPAVATRPGFQRARRIIRIRKKR